MASSKEYDVIVIGGGPAGYVGAIRAAQLGLKTACIEKDKTLGGTCLNVGCIPSKALLESSEHFAFAKVGMDKHGIGAQDIKLDLEKMMRRKDTIVRQLTGGIEGLLKKNKIDRVLGKGRLISSDDSGVIVEIEVDAKGDVGSGEKIQLTGKRVLLATGSEAVELPFMPFDGKSILSSTEALELSSVPKHLVVVGGGAIGLEMGSVWLRLGAKVTVIEFQDRLIPGMDRQISKELQKILTNQGMEFLLATKCLGAKEAGDGTLIVEIEEISTGEKAKIEADKVLVATGRKPYSDGLGLDALGIKTDKAGRVEISDTFQTTCPAVFAVGDLVKGPMLAHKAEEEAVAAVEIMCGQAGHVNYNTIPGIVYTWPEVAGVGATEDELMEKGIKYKVGSFPFMANGRAKAMGEDAGLVKIIADASTDRVLGAHMIGATVSELISEMVTVMEFGGSAEDVARTCHGHPTLSETVKEAALDVAKRRIHL